MKQCECGCGTLIPEKDNRNRPKRFVWGHGNMKTLKKYAKKKGQIPWNVGIKTGHMPWNKGIKGLYAGDTNPFYGKKHTEETRAKMRGSHNGNWHNGVSRKSDLIRKSIEYIEWRTAVFIRDNRTCVLCSSTRQIEADHIKPFSIYPELRFEVSNGRTLCHDCHKKTDTYGNTKKTR